MGLKKHIELDSPLKFLFVVGIQYQFLKIQDKERQVFATKSKFFTLSIKAFRCYLAKQNSYCETGASHKRAII